MSDLNTAVLLFGRFGLLRRLRELFDQIDGVQSATIVSDRATG